MPGIQHPDGAAGIIRDLARRVRRLESSGTSVVEKVNTVSASGSTLTLPDVFTATMHDVTLTANCTLTFPAVGAGKSFSLRLAQDGTGSRTVTWPGTVKWDSGTAPTISTAASSVDAFAFACIDGSHWLGFFAGKGMA